MNIKIGERIKRLRKKLDVTQERLAEYLGVTSQAISRWESEICYPDIELLPALADFFSISIDELLDVDFTQKETQINKLIAEADIAQKEGNFEKAILIYRSAVSQYPSSHKLQANLACAIGCIDNGKKISHELAFETINICNRILEDCAIDTIRYQAMSILCWVYHKHLDDFDKAMQIVEKFPTLYLSQEMVQTETLGIRLPSKKAEQFLYTLTSAMLLVFNKPKLAYSNDRKDITRTLIKELEKYIVTIE